MARISRPTVIAAVAAIAIAALAGIATRVPRALRATTSHDAPPAQGGTLIASLRSDPATYNRLAPDGDKAATELVSLLTQARLVRVNRATDALEPWLAEHWEASDDHRTYTLHLRQGLRFSDGAPFSSADVLFSLQAAYDPTAASPLRSAMEVDGRPLDVSAPDPDTVVISFPAPYGPGLRILDNLPILPAHVLAPALAAGRFRDAWTPAGPATDVVGMGPFVLTEHVSGQRLVFRRNPHYFRQDDRGVRLPYLEGITVLVVPDQSAEALRLQAGDVDVLTNAGIRPDDHAAFKRSADEGRLRLVDVGVSLDADFLWFNLRPAASTGARALFARREFRQAISAAIDRRAIVDGVYLGAAEPVLGPITPANRTWFDPSLTPPPFDPAHARALLASIDVRDRDGDGLVEDAAGRPVRFSVVTQAGHLRQRVVSALQAQLRSAGIAIDIVPLDPHGIIARWSDGDYDAIYFGQQASATDPALNPEYWLSTGQGHAWHPSQRTPATAWEAEIDRLFHEQATAEDPAVRYRAFARAQRILADEAPAIYIASPRVFVATTARVRGVVAVPMAPQILWNADSLALAPVPGS